MFFFFEKKTTKIYSEYFNCDKNNKGQMKGILILQIQIQK